MLAVRHHPAHSDKMSVLIDNEARSLCVSVCVCVCVCVCVIQK